MQLPVPVRIEHVPGMQGDAPGDRWLVRALVEAGFEQTSLFAWTGYRWPLNNLRDRRQHRRVGRQLAERLQDLHRRDEAVRHVLIGHSTGAMVILEALARLGTAIVDQAWLLNAAVSRRFDLRPALAGTRRLINVYSPLDWAVLNLGTRVFGSADGLREPCAGFQPFIGPGCDDGRVEQIQHRRGWLRSGHYGGHLGALTPVNRLFVRDVLAPMIVERLAPTAAHEDTQSREPA